MPFPKLIECAGQPTYQERFLTHYEMFQNLKAIVSLHNGVHAGYLGILMDITVCVTHYDGVFIPPVDLGDYPHLFTAAILYQKAEALACHKWELLEYREYGAVLVCCFNQLQKAIHKDYLVELKDAHLGLTKKTFFKMSSHNMQKSPFQ